MSRGLAPLVWHPEDGTRSFSLLSPPSSSPAFPRRSLEDSRTQRASATCSTWDGPGWRNHKGPRKISATSNTDTWILGQPEQTYHLHSYCTHPEYPSQSSLGLCGTHSRKRWVFYSTGFFLTTLTTTIKVEKIPKAKQQ